MLHDYLSSAEKQKALVFVNPNSVGSIANQVKVKVIFDLLSLERKAIT
jgi:hypothetical protein